MRLTFFVTALMFIAAIHRIDAAAAAAPSHRATTDAVVPGTAGLRAMAPWIAQLLADARPLSPTLDGLVREIAEADLIVHVAESADDGASFDGRIYFVTTAGRYRYLRVELRRLAPPLAAAVLAHELQHALEVAAAGVSTGAEFAALYRRIGTATGHTEDGHYDTAAAVAAGRTAIRELTGRPVRHPRLTAP